MEYVKNLRMLSFTSIWYDYFDALIMVIVGWKKADVKNL